MTTNRRLGFRARVMLSAMAPVAGCLLLSACADKTQTASTSQPGDSALHDPMGYKVNMDNMDISGGGIGHYDSKGMKRDLNDVLDP